MSEHLLLALLRLSGEFSVALLLVLALRPALRRSLGAGIAYAAWMLVPLLLGVAQLPASAPGLVLHKLVVDDAPASLSIAPMALKHGFELQARLLLALWGFGVIAVLTVLALRQRRFIRGLRFDAVHERWRAPAGNGPALVGVFMPRLCLPDDFEQRFTPVQQALILAHEDVHRRRGDNAWNLLTAVICALQWFNPLAWWAARAMRADQELACDAAVLRRTPDQAADYAHALLQAQGLSHANGLPWASWRSTHPLVERIAMLKIHAHARRRTGLAVLLMLGLLGAGGVHAWQASPEPIATGKPDLRLAFSLQYGEPRPAPEQVQKWRISRVVDLAQGQPYRVAMGNPNSAEQVEYTITASPRADGHWDLRLQLRRGEPWQTVASPRIVLANGSPGTIDSTLPGGGELIAFFVPTALHDGKPVIAATP